MGKPWFLDVNLILTLNALSIQCAEDQTVEKTDVAGVMCVKEKGGGGQLTVSLHMWKS